MHLRQTFNAPVMEVSALLILKGTIGQSRQNPSQLFKNAFLSQFWTRVIMYFSFCPPKHPL
jgi:hypothetical protein